MNVTVVVGNPKARSRTYEAAHLAAEKLTGQTADLSVDLAVPAARQGRRAHR